MVELKMKYYLNKPIPNLVWLIHTWSNDDRYEGEWKAWLSTVMVQIIFPNGDMKVYIALVLNFATRRATEVEKYAIYNYKLTCFYFY